jgi:hypothetical protein
MLPEAGLPSPSCLANKPTVLLSSAASLLLTERAVYALASAISMLARQASVVRLPGPGDSPVSVAWMRSVRPSRSSTAHHILVPAVFLIGEGVALAVAVQAWKMDAACCVVKLAANAVLTLPKATVAPNISVFNFLTICSCFAKLFTQVSVQPRSKKIIPGRRSQLSSKLEQPQPVL